MRVKKGNGRKGMSYNCKGNDMRFILDGMGTGRK